MYAPRHILHYVERTQSSCNTMNDEQKALHGKIILQTPTDIVSRA